MNMRIDGSMRQPGVPDVIPESGSALANVAQWVQQQNANLQQLSSHSSGVSFSSPTDGQALRPNGRYGRMMQQWGGSSPGPQPVPQDMIGPQGYQMCGPQQGFAPDMNMGGPGDMLHGSVPKENLTPQQLQKREEGLAHLRKIGQMLNIDSSGGSGPGPMMHMHGNPDGVMPGEGWPDPMMHPNMGMPRPRMALSPTDSMMGMNFTQRMGPFMGPGGLPLDWDNMTPEQKDWHKMQQEFYLDKCRKQQMQMGMNVPPGASGGGGPNRSHMGFFHPIQQMHRMPGPMSPGPPTFPGGSVSSPHCGPMINPNDPHSMMFAKQSEFGGMCQGMGPDQNFDHPSGMPREGIFPFPDGSMPSGRLGSMSGESFSPAEFSHPAGGQQGMVKIAPAFGAPPKRKRSANTMSDPEDIYKRLLPAPSPQQFSYMNSLDGQELTITKQLNHAFQEQSGGVQAPPLPSSSSPATYPPPQKSRSSGSKKKKTQTKADQKPKSQRTPPAADPFTCPSPAVPASAATTSASFQSAPAASPISQTSVSSMSSSLANVVSTPTVIANRASSADPNAVTSSAATSAAGAPAMKSSMTNITSASLANLAKGVENLSAQIQHNPFRTVQMQENESDVSDVSPPDNSSLLPSVGASHGPGPQANNPQNNSGIGNSHGGPMHPMQTSNPSMQQQMTPTHLMGSPPGSVRSASHSMAPKPGSGSLTDPTGLMTCGGRQSSPIFPVDDQGLDPGSRFCFSGSTGMPAGGVSGGQQMFSQMGPSPGTSGCRPTNGGNMVTGNAKIQIQAQTPNTIQYLPSGGHPGDGMGDGFMEFQVDAKPFGKGGMPPFGAMMDGIHGSMMSSGEMMQRRQMDLQMMQEASGTSAMHQQMRMDAAAFDQMHSLRGSMHGPRGPIPGPSGSMHMPVGSVHGPGSPILSSGMMHSMGNPMHGPGSPAMGLSGSMHDQTSPMMGPGSIMGPGGHMMGELLQMQGHMKQGMRLNGGGDFGGMVMGPGGRGAEMMQDMGPMGMQHRSMHPDAMMMSGASPPEFSGPHRGDPGIMSMMAGCGGMMGPEMSMATREGMMAMRGAPGGMRPEMVIERSRSNRSRQKARAAEAVESRIRSEAAAAGMMVGDGGAGRMGGPGAMGMEMMGGMMRSEMGMMGMRHDMMGIPGMGPGDRMGMRPDAGMMVQRGNGMPPEMAMMSSRGTAAGRMGMMEGMPQDSVGMFNFGPGRRGMPPEAMDMMPPGMNPSEMCPPGMKSMVMGGSSVGQPPGSGMGPDPGYGVPYQQFQQQLYAQSRSPTMSPGMMRGGMPGGPVDMMGRPQYDMMGPGPGMTPGSSMGFGQSQPGLGPM